MDAGRARKRQIKNGRVWARGVVALSAAVMLAGGGLAAAGAAAAQVPAAAPVLAPTHTSTDEAADTGCPVTAGTLTWGVKESFRAYISGTIANGSWDVADGATYETPNFGWSNPTGSFDEETGAGTASFTGTVHFSGHDGILNMTLANPQIEVVSPTEAYLLLDMRSNDPNGTEVVNESGVRAAELGLTAPLEVGSDATVTMEGVTATLTEPGVVAFADFYEQGSALDPITFSLTFGECAQAAVETPAATTPGNLENDNTIVEAPIWIWVVVAVVIIGAGVAVIVWRRRARK